MAHVAYLMRDARAPPVRRNVFRVSALGIHASTLLSLPLLKLSMHLCNPPKGNGNTLPLIFPVGVYLVSGYEKAPKENPSGPVFAVVGGIGFEPMTSSASGKRSSAELTTHSAENSTGPGRYCQGFFCLHTLFEGLLPSSFSDTPPKSHNFRYNRIRNATEWSVRVLCKREWKYDVFYLNSSR